MNKSYYTCAYVTVHTFISLIQKKKNNQEIPLNQRNFSLTV